VIQAIDNCRRAGLFVSLSLCATKEFVSEENLLKYAMLARDNGVHLIRILEARNSGRFSGQDVNLNTHQIEILERFITDINNKPEYLDYPITNFVGFHQRRIGCKGAGDRYLYIDSIGDFHACPFCQDALGNALCTPLEEARQNLAARGCHYLQQTRA
jgi:MoaA/NifB/PqqE/SkfB family radical SAM enzyme